MDEKFVLTFNKCMFCNNIIIKNLVCEYDNYIKKFLTIHPVIKKTNRYRGIYDESCDRAYILCTSCFEKFTKLKMVKNLMNREKTGISPKSSYVITNDDIKIFMKEFQNIMTEESCTLVKSD